MLISWEMIKLGFATPAEFTMLARLISSSELILPMIISRRYLLYALTLHCPVPSDKPYKVSAMLQPVRLQLTYLLEQLSKADEDLTLLRLRVRRSGIRWDI
jgi:hypothetical protein